MDSDSIWFFFIIVLQFLFIISSLININTRLGKRRRHPDEESSSSTPYRPDAGPIESDEDFLACVLDNLTISNFKLKIRNEQAIRLCEVMKINPTNRRLHFVKFIKIEEWNQKQNREVNMDGIMSANKRLMEYATAGLK